jgi:hypothetical protein
MVSNTRVIARVGGVAGVGVVDVVGVVGVVGVEDVGVPFAADDSPDPQPATAKAGRRQITARLQTGARRRIGPR